MWLSFLETNCRSNLGCRDDTARAYHVLFSGQIKLEGNIMQAMKLSGMFKTMQVGTSQRHVLLLRKVIIPNYYVYLDCRNKTGYFSERYLWRVQVKRRRQVVLWFKINFRVYYIVLFSKSSHLSSLIYVML